MSARPKLTPDELRRAKDAARKREARARQREARALPSGATDHPAPVGLPIHETVPDEGPGADAFTLDPSAFASASDASSSSAEPVPPPLVEPAPEPPPPPPPDTPLQAAAIAGFVAMTFQAGVIGLYETVPKFREFVDSVPFPLPPGANHPLAVLPMVAAFVHAQATDVCVRRGLRIPYQAELVTVGALGLGVAGIAIKRKAQLAAVSAPAPEPARPAPVASEPVRPAPVAAVPSVEAVAS